MPNQDESHRSGASPKLMDRRTLIQRLSGSVAAAAVLGPTTLHGLKGLERAAKERVGEPRAVSVGSIDVRDVNGTVVHTFKFDPIHMVTGDTCVFTLDLDIG
jgi:hypothetical protein